MTSNQIKKAEEILAQWRAIQLLPEELARLEQQWQSKLHRAIDEKLAEASQQAEQERFAEAQQMVAELRQFSFANHHRNCLAEWYLLKKLG